MRIETAFQNYVSTKSAIVAVIGTRVFPQLVPEALLPGLTDNYPAITYDVISRNHIHAMGGASQMAYSRIQTTCFARTYKAAHDLSELMRLSLDGYTGTWGGVSGVFVGSCLLVDEGDSLSASPGDDAQRIYGVRQDWMIGHDETSPTL